MKTTGPESETTLYDSASSEEPPEKTKELAGMMAPLLRSRFAVALSARGEIVDYAAARFVTVIPEIELPGHSLAALSAYPEYACTEGPFEPATGWGIFPDIYCPTEETFAFLEGVLGEVLEIFPSRYIHIGGDEAPKERWRESPEAQAVIRREALRLLEAFDVRPRDPEIRSANMSGGNQQKAILAREIDRAPEVLIVGQPTRGVDIGAIEFIHRRLIELRDAGKAVLLVSAELEEVLSLADRVLVMCGGRLVGAMATAEADVGEIGLMMAGVAGDAA